MITPDHMPQLLTRRLLAALEDLHGRSLDDKDDRAAVAEALTRALQPTLDYVCEECGRHVALGDRCPGNFCRGDIDHHDL